MVEEKTEEKKEEHTDEDDKSGDKEVSSPVLDKVERAENAIKRMEELEKNIDEKTKVLQDLRATKILGGQTDAGIQTEKPKEETPKEYNDRIEKEMSEGKHGE